MKYADFGTVSHGTLRDADLLRSFGDELEYHVKRNAKALDKNTRKRYLALVKEAAGLNPDDASDDEFEFVLDLVHGLMDALDKFSPPDGYFGPHPGDGAYLVFGQLKPMEKGHERFIIWPERRLVFDSEIGSLYASACTNGRHDGSATSPNSQIDALKSIGIFTVAKGPRT